MKLLLLGFFTMASFSTFANDIVLNAGERTNVQVNGCLNGQVGKVKQVGNQIEALCEDKVCVTESYGLAGLNEKIAKIEVFPTGEEVQIHLRGKKLIRNKMKALIQEGICTKATIHWMNSTENFELKL